MPDPCRTCDRRSEDFGGCRCQAYLLANDRNATDPVCSLAPKHHLVETAVQQANANVQLSQPSPASSFVQLKQLNQELWSYRTNPE